MKATDGAATINVAYQLSDIISTVKTRAKDTALSNALLTDFINETQNEVLGHRRYAFMERVANDTLTAGQYQLDAPEACQIIDYLMLEVDGAEWTPDYLPHRVFFEPGRPNLLPDTDGRPSWFTLHADSITFDRRADVTYDVTLHYLAKPTTLSADADVPSIPEAYREILIRGALARVEEYRENFDIAALHQRKIEELTEDMNLRYGLRQLISAPKQTRGGFRRASC